MSLIRGDALSLPLRDESVDLVVTSPPYFALRSYTDGGEHYDGQIGSEATPAEFIAALVAVTAECVRVLKPSGSIWVNLGDKYAGSGGHNNNGISPKSTLSGNGHKGGVGAAGPNKIKSTRRSAPDRYNQASDGIRAKSLMGLPWRYALRCIDDLGLILRAEVIWSKPNGLPESVTDRVRRSHEQWFMFTKEPRYFSAVDNIRESRGDAMELVTKHAPGCPLFVGPVDPLASSCVGGSHEGVAGVEDLDLTDEEGTDQRVQRQACMGAEQDVQAGPGGSTIPLLVSGDSVLNEDRSDLLDDGLASVVDRQPQVGGRSVASVAQVDGALSVDDPSQPSKVCTCAHSTYRTALGKLPGSVRTVATEPLKVPDHLDVDHFAAFPSEWPRWIISGWSPSGICTSCGEGRRPVVEKDRDEPIGYDSSGRFGLKGQPGDTPLPKRYGSELATITGESCACPTPDAPTRPAVVLDPFAGTGTTPAVANALGRHGIGVDLSADYLRLARWRCGDDKLRRKVLGLDAAPVEHVGQTSLLDLLAPPAHLEASRP